MATDIAFSLGVLSVFSSRVPLGLKVFLAALAVADDLGGILVIALFYSSEINITFLLLSAVCIAVMIIANRLKCRSKAFYVIFGLVLWYMMLNSGIHATIAGVIVAFCIPATLKKGTGHYLERIRENVNKFPVIDVDERHNTIVLSNEDIHTLKSIESAADKMISPLQDLEDNLHFLINYLVSCLHKSLSEAQAAKAEAEELVKKVKAHTEETEKLAAQQKKVVEDIASISATLTVSGEQMHTVAENINEAANRQQETIEEISADIVTITDETANSLDAAEKASEAAARSTVLMNESNDEMNKMIDAMAEIEESSAKIQDIVKTIEDIAFQTNILALNASIEAARAGEAGKGFAVVADEVRNLAGKSQDAVQNTTELINASLEAVQRGREVADGVAGRMGAVISTAEESAVHADSIAKLTEKQAAAIAAVKDRIDYISNIISETSQTAVQSADIAASVADDTKKMDDIVSEFRD